MKRPDLLTIIAVMITVSLFSGMVIVGILSANGDMEGDLAVQLLVFFSGMLSMVVLIYGALALSQSNAERYRIYAEEKEKRDR